MAKTLEVESLYRLDPDKVNARDLQGEMKTLDAAKTSYECWIARLVGEAEAVTILYVPDAFRAGVCWGANADWTDAESAEDALERYCGTNDKEMAP